MNVSIRLLLLFFCLLIEQSLNVAGSVLKNLKINSIKEPPPSDSILGVFSSAAISADGFPCNKIGGDILRKGGSAIDAAVATSFCLGVTVSESLGLGGGFFSTFYTKKTKKVLTMDCRETAPSGSFPDMFHGDKKRPAFGGSAVAVPGITRCYWELWNEYGGNVPWSSIIEPSIELCEKGFPVSSHMANSLREKRVYILNETTMSDFINPTTGNVWKEGDILKQPQLGKTLRILQKEPEAIVNGSLTDSFLEDLKSLGSPITKSDLNNYLPIRKDPISVTLQNGGYTVYSLPPPSSGVLLGFILNVLDNYNFTSESVNEQNIVTTYQRIVETFKYAYGRRTELGDEDFVDMRNLISQLTSEKYAHEIYSKILDTKTVNNASYYGAVVYNPEDSGTSNLAVIDKYGNAVALTSTINLYFGAVVTSVSTGIVLNDEMDDFSYPNITNSFGLPPSPANFIQEGKRPLSSMVPTIILDSNQDVVLVTGAAGGTRITSSVAWQIMNYLWFGKDLKESVDSSRLHHQVLPMLLRYEPGFRMDILNQMKKLGHNISALTAPSVISTLSRHPDGELNAVSDFRKSISCIDGY